MNFAVSRITFLALVLMTPILSTAMTPPEDSVATAVFADTLQIPDVQKRAQRGLGFVLQNGHGQGIVYSQNVASKVRAWVRGIYASDRYVFLEDYAPSSLVAHAEIHERSRLQVALGVDQIFHLTQNKNWGLVLGGGAGMNKSEYQSRYYRKLCTFFCGFDPRDPVEKNETDLFGFISGTLGVGFFDIQILGLNGELKMVITPILARTGNFVFTGPDGREFTPAIAGSYVIETLVTF